MRETPRYLQSAIATYRCGGSSGFVARQRDSPLSRFTWRATSLPIRAQAPCFNANFSERMQQSGMPNAHSDWRRYRRLLSFVRPWRTRLVAGMAMLASVSLLEPLIQIAFSQILDRAFVSSADNGAAATRSALARGFLGPVSEALQAIPILWFPVLLVALFAVRSAANFLGDFALHWVASRVVFDLRSHVFAHLLRLPSAFFDRNATAELTSKITYDAQQVGAVTSQALTTLVQDSLKLVAAIAMMASVSWRLTLGVFVIAPVVAVVVRAMTRRLRAASVALQTQMGELARFTDEALSNQRAVKIYAAFQRMGSSFTERADAVRRTIMRQETANAASAPLMHLVVSIAIAGIVALAIIGATPSHDGRRLLHLFHRAAVAAAADEESVLGQRGASARARRGDVAVCGARRGGRGARHSTRRAGGAWGDRVRRGQPALCRA